jgi:transposase
VRVESEPDRGDHRQPGREERGKGDARVDLSGYDAGKKVKGKKRHILVDTLGLLLSAAIHLASVQDRDGAVPLLRAARRLFPFVEVIFADGPYRGETTADAVAGIGRWRLEIVRRGDGPGSVPLLKRSLVERSFAWLGRCRRLAKDFENLAVNALAFLCLGMIRLMLRRLARASDRS